MIRHMRSIPRPELQSLERGIDGEHFLFHFIRRVFLDGRDVTALGIVWVGPCDDQLLALRTEPGQPQLAPAGIAVMHPLRGHVELELHDAVLDSIALADVIAYYPDLVGHVRPLSSERPENANAH